MIQISVLLVLVLFGRHERTAGLQTSHGNNLQGFSYGDPWRPGLV